MTKNEKNQKPKQTTAKKRILYEAVKEHPEKEHTIVGALTLAGLVKQYEYEKSVYGVEDLEPSITDDELNKIIKKYVGA